MTVQGIHALAGKTMSLGLSVYKLGYHRAAWRMPDFPRDAMTSIRPFVDAAKTAEAAAFDFVFFADVLAVENVQAAERDIAFEHYVVKFDPVVALSAIAMTTKRIGLIATMSTTHAHPYNIARAVGSLDLVSGGRAGWNIVTSYSSDEIRNFGMASLPEPASRYARAHEAVAVVAALWDSWSQTSFPQDKASGVFLDRATIKAPGHRGRYFSVDGPLDVGRSPQGVPVLVAAGDSPAAQDLAARYANIQYAPTIGDIAAAKTHYRAVKERMVHYGRAPQELKIMPGLMPIVGETDLEARRKLEAIRALIHPQVGLDLLRPLFGDLSDCDPDAPLPRSVEPAETVMGGYAKHVFERAIADGLSLRQTYELVGDQERWFMTRVGSYKQVADVMEEWFAEEAADGFNLLPYYVPGGLSDFVGLVVPELRRRGLFRSSYRGSTLRDTIGLAAPGRDQGADCRPKVSVAP
ncbi:MAG: NtaA/DmoA family FMN-dependent monooxygenase [Pseudomonadota bacterium]|jgi:FMN-dependent oxidoreductase (nitrilotriacetate monooxygenase family)